MAVIFFLSLYFNGHFPREPGLAGFIGAKDDGSGVDNLSCKTCKALIKSSPPTNVLQAGCPSCLPANGVGVLKGRMAAILKVVISLYLSKNPIIYICDRLL